MKYTKNNETMKFKHFEPSVILMTVTYALLSGIKAAALYILFFISDPTNNFESPLPTLNIFDSSEVRSTLMVSYRSLISYISSRPYFHYSIHYKHVEKHRAQIHHIVHSLLSRTVKNRFDKLIVIFLV